MTEVFKTNTTNLVKSGAITPKIGTDNVAPSFWCA